MATSNNISGMRLLQTPRRSGSKWIAVSHDSANVPTSFLGSFAMRDLILTNFGEAQ
jgi:hypothetical protein